MATVRKQSADSHIAAGYVLVISKSYDDFL